MQVGHIKYKCFGQGILSLVLVGLVGSTNSVAILRGVGRVVCV